MPIYEYTCLKCNQSFELLIRNSKEKAKCPACGSTRAEKKFSLFGMKTNEKFASSKGGSSCTSCSRSSCETCSS